MNGGRHRTVRASRRRSDRTTDEGRGRDRDHDGRRLDDDRDRAGGATA
jgi:hypothetical protein